MYYQKTIQMVHTKKELKLILNNINTLEKFQENLFERGHTFWHCNAQDVEHNKPFYYYQINKSKHMSTCSTCSQLMENRKEIRRLQKLIGVEQTPLYTNYTDIENLLNPN